MYENLPEEELYKYLKLLNDTKQGVYTEIRNRKIPCKHPQEEIEYLLIDFKKVSRCNICGSII